MIISAKELIAQIGNINKVRVTKLVTNVTSDLRKVKCQDTKMYIEVNNFNNKDIHSNKICIEIKCDAVSYESKLSLDENNIINNISIKKLSDYMLVVTIDTYGSITFYYPKFDIKCLCSKCKVIEEL